MGERINSVLTESQREYLHGKEISDAGARMARRRIRDRLQSSVFDYSLILENLSLEDITEAFTDTNPPATEPNELRNVSNQLHKVVGLLYLGFTETKTTDTPKTAFEGVIENGIRRAYNKRGESIESVNVSIDIEEGQDLEGLRGQDDLTYTEAKQLLEGGEIGADEFLELASKALAEPDDESRPDNFGDIGKSRAEWLAALEGVNLDRDDE